MRTPISRQPEVVAAVREFLIEQGQRPNSDLLRYGEVGQVCRGIYSQ